VAPVIAEPAAAASSGLVLLQDNGEHVTTIGQLVLFFGTGGFRGQNTPVEHQADLLDEYMVMKIEVRPAGRRALIMKKNPIAVQPAIQS
jgi:hypothetical protein